MQSTLVNTVRALVDVARTNRFVVISVGKESCRAEATRLARLISRAQARGYQIERYADCGMPIDLEGATRDQLFGAAVGVRLARR